MALRGSAFLVFATLISVSLAKVTLTTNGLAATVSNGNVEVVFKADATVSAVKVNGVNIVSTSQKTFYLDWNENGQVTFNPSELKVGENSDSLAHFYWIQNGASNQFHIEFHYVMVDGVSGIYSWAKYINSQSGTVSLGETRTIYRFDSSILTQGTNQARSGTLYLYSYLNTQTKVQDETWQLADGTYYTKYDYAGYLRETSYQGVYGNGYGAFVISPSREYHAGGPLKQDLLIHQDSLIANYFVSSHFGTSGLSAPSGWTHIYGPWLIYFNTGSDSAILSDVANRAQTEKSSWPYSFVNDDAYPRSRGTVTGKITGQPKAAVMLYDSTETFDDQQLGYAFTTESDSSGSYTLTNVRPGTYNVVAYPLAGQGSENLATSTVTVAAGGTATVSTLNLPEPGNIIWNIGETDRRSDEFKYSNEPRNYLYETLPPETLTFVIGSSNAANDWYYSQSKAGIWTIQYEDTQDGNGRTLRVALAAASQSPHLIVNINGHKIGDIYFDNDQSVYRSAMQSGKFHSNIFTANNAQIVSGTNVITLQVSKGQVMYDAISLQRVAVATVTLTTSGLTATVSNGDVTVVFNAHARVSSVKIDDVNIVSTTENSFYLDWNENGEVSFSPSSLTVVNDTDSLAHFYWLQDGASDQFEIELHYLMGVYGSGYGAFLISPSREYHAGGPLKQDLLIHQDSLITNYFVSSHFGTSGLTAPSGWTHIYGPWLLYFNTGTNSAILSDVATQAETEKDSWPYSFVNDDDYPVDRGTVKGTITGQPLATIMLYDTEETSYDDQQLGYAFTTESDSSGSYTLKNVRPGIYNVVAYPVAGQGSETVTVSSLDLPEPDDIIWNIGETNRRSSEFKYSTELRNYLYETLPPETLTFTIGTSTDADDWYYAQSQAGIWTIEYDDAKDGNTRTLRVALAAASQSPHLIVSVNSHKVGDVYYGNDQAVYRSAMQSGTFHSNVFTVTNAQVVNGTNTITLQVSKGKVMYDAISF
ncbi:hypothetical protein HUJ05_000098 [Dendroctonus ponderosae]|nr:hypothetical protein HUJ05_000098 [Dendroctonus ponderosae]